jgi:hypothetical protein
VQSEGGEGTWGNLIFRTSRRQMLQSDIFFWGRVPETSTWRERVKEFKMSGYCTAGDEMADDQAEGRGRVLIWRDVVSLACQGG